MKYPKIGIRPVIDGRWGGVRESLEDQTMGMAKAAAKLLEEEMEQVAHLSVPLTAEAHWGRNWLEAKG